MWFARLVLWAGLVGLPVFGLARWLQGPPETPLEIAARAALAGAAAIVLVGGRGPARERWTVLGSRVLTFALQGWFQMVGPWNARAQTALLVTSLATLSFTSVAEMVALWAWTSTAMVVGSWGDDTLWSALAASFVSNTLVSVVVGTGTWYLRGLERALVDQGSLLEQRVRDRTSELRTAVDRLEAEVRERRTAEEAALRANLTKSVFLANMSHELRTPLNAILGYTELLLEEAPEAARDLGRIRDSGRHLLRMIEDVLDLSKIDSGRIELVWQVVDVPEVVARSVALVQPLASSRGLALVVEMPDRLPLRADPDRLVQVLVNLLSNAVKFTREGQVDVRVRQADRQVTIAVSDTGPGIEEAQLARIFDRFVQVDGSTTRRIGGTGLGLAISRELAGLMGAELTVRSAVGEGSTFTLTFQR